MFENCHKYKDKILNFKLRPMSGSKVWCSGFTFWQRFTFTIDIRIFSFQSGQFFSLLAFYVLITLPPQHSTVFFLIWNKSEWNTKPYVHKQSRCTFKIVIVQNIKIIFPWKFWRWEVKPTKLDVYYYTCMFIPELPFTISV